MALRIGRNAVMERLKSQEPIERLYIDKQSKGGSLSVIVAMAKDAGIPVFPVPEKKLDDLAEGKRHQGVVAMVGEFAYTPVEIILAAAKDAEHAPKLVILAGIEDPHNLGAIIRTAECAGFDGVIIPDRRACTVNETVARTSAGAVEHMAIAKVANLTDTIMALKKEGLWIYGADMDGNTSLYDADLTGPLALVIGAEGKGMGPKIKSHCDVILSIPMRGRINSLNASNAAALMIYEAMRRETGHD